MKRSKRPLALALTMLMLAGSLSGCTLVQFDDPADIKQQEEEIEKQQNAALPDLDTVLDAEHLVIDEKLTNNEGRTIAAYQARFPYFEAGDNVALQNINEFYASEFSHLESDKNRFFELAAEKPTDTVHTSVFDYELLDAGDIYVSVLRSFEVVDSLGDGGTLYTGEVFSGATGLRLKFTDVFAKDAAKAVETLRTVLADWCGEQKYDAAWLDGLTDEVLCENFAFDEDILYIGFDRGTVPGGETLIELDLGDFEAYMA